MAAPGSLRRFAANSALVALGFLLTLLADRAVGFVLGLQTADQRHTGLVLPPNARFSYVTSEFDVRATINQLGFRDREFELSKTRLRIFAIGNSFTYGWGVADDEPWPKVLERELRREGRDLEVANLGRPGAALFQYADIAERAIPILKPDLVIVAVLQGDDFASEWWNTRTLAERLDEIHIADPRKALLRTKLALWRCLQPLYPNTTGLIASARQARKGRTAPSAGDFASAASEQARRFESGLDDTERLRFARLPDTIKAAFRSGDLNPHLVHLAVEQPSHFTLTMDTNSPRAQRVIREMSRQLHRVQAIAKQYGSRAVIASVPSGAYVSLDVCRSLQPWGFLCDPGFVASGAPDEVIRRAAQGAGLPFFEVTEGFRAAGNAGLYFPRDLHFTAAGHRLYGDLLARAIVGEVEPRSPSH